MSQLKIQANENAGEYEVALEGSIDEDVDFSSVELEAKSKIVVDFSKVDAINSCGIREWIKLMGTAGQAEEIKFQNCPKVIVDQINMVEGFLPNNGLVESFFVPYYSDESGEEKSVLFSRGHEFDDSGVKPPTIEDEDGEEMEMDVIEAKYFKFLNR